MSKGADNRVILRRSRESQRLREIGLIVFCVFLLLSIWLFRISGEAFVTVVSIAVLLFPSVVVTIRDLYTRIILLDDYISVGRWPWTPRVWRYDEIVGVETKKSNDNSWAWWSETCAVVTFDDGARLKVRESLISVRRFRKLLSEKAGRKFRKPTKSKKNSIQQ